MGCNSFGGQTFGSQDPSLEAEISNCNLQPQEKKPIGLPRQLNRETYEVSHVDIPETALDQLEPLQVQSILWPTPSA